MTNKMLVPKEIRDIVENIIKNAEVSLNSIEDGKDRLFATINLGTALIAGSLRMIEEGARMDIFNSLMKVLVKECLDTIPPSSIAKDIDKKLAELIFVNDSFSKDSETIAH